jgi:hypothetical protein
MIPVARANRIVHGALKLTCLSKALCIALLSVLLQLSAAFAQSEDNPENNNVVAVIDSIIDISLEDSLDFEVTDRSLTKLKKLKIPPFIQTKLKDLKGRKFSGKSNFLKELKELAKDFNADQKKQLEGYKFIILRLARKPELVYKPTDKVLIWRDTKRIPAEPNIQLRYSDSIVVEPGYDIVLRIKKDLKYSSTSNPINYQRIKIIPISAKPLLDRRYESFPDSQRMVRIDTTILIPASPNDSPSLIPTKTVFVINEDGSFCLQQGGALFKEKKPESTSNDTSKVEMELILMDSQAIFSDPDGDPLNYSTQSLNPSVATTSLKGSVLEVTLVTEGKAQIIVNADDNISGSVSDTFLVTVKGNLPPEVENPLPDTTIRVTDPPVERDLEAPPVVFFDPDGDSLSYSTQSLNLSFTVTVSNPQPTTRNNKSPAINSVPEKNGNTPPRVVNTIPDIILTVGGPPFTMDLNFAPVDGRHDNGRHYYIEKTEFYFKAITGDLLNCETKEKEPPIRPDGDESYDPVAFFDLKPGDVKPWYLKPQFYIPAAVAATAVGVSYFLSGADDTGAGGRQSLPTPPDFP